MAITVSVSVDRARCVHVTATWFPAGADWRSRQVLADGRFMLPPAALTRQQCLALVGEYLARGGGQALRTRLPDQPCLPIALTD